MLVTVSAKDTAQVSQIQALPSVSLKYNRKKHEIRKGMSMPKLLWMLRRGGCGIQGGER